MENSIGKQKQCLIRNYLLIHGIYETRDENANEIVLATLKEKVDLEMPENNIDCTHIGTGTLTRAKPRPITTMFVKYAETKLIKKIITIFFTNPFIFRLAFESHCFHGHA